MIKNILTREFHRLAVDDEVRQLLGNLSALLLVLRKVELLTQLHVKNLYVKTWFYKLMPDFIGEIQWQYK